MDLRLLNYFVAVYEERNVTKAAARCFVSQPSLSNAIRQLESELGTQLFIRASKGMEVTDEAAHLYPRAKRLLDESKDLTAMFKDESETAMVVVGTFPDLSPSHMKKALERIKDNFPQVSLRLVDHDGICDVRVSLDVLKREDELFIPLWDEKYVLCVHSSHPFAERKLVLPEDLDGQKFIECPPCEAHHQTIGLLADSMHQMEIVARADHKLQVMHLVQANYGISFLPTGVMEFSSGVVSVPFEGPTMSRKIGLCCPASKSRRPVLDELIGLLSVE